MTPIQQSDIENLVALHYIHGIDFRAFHDPDYPIEKPVKSPTQGSDRREKETAKVIFLHYVGGIDFPLFHEPPYPLKKAGAQKISKDPRGERFVRRDIHFNRQRQLQRG